MATLWVTEYDDVPQVRGAPTPLAMEPAIASQTVTFTTTTQSSAFNAETRYVRCISTVACHLAFGTNPTATTSTQYLPAGQEAWRRVEPAHKVAAVTAS